MRIGQHRGGAVIVLTFVVALLLTMLPLPGWLELARPHWVLLTLIYWCMALPSRVSVGIGWILGLLLDVALDALLGQHALAIALVAFFTVQLHQRLRVFPLWQQAIVIFVFCLIYNIVILWVKGISGVAPSLWLFLIPSFTSALIWPLIFVSLRQVRRIYRVA